MKNPIVSNKTSLRFYISIWIFIAIGHFSLFFFVVNRSLLESILDSLVFNGVFAFVGYNIWYVARFAGFTRESVATTLITHLVSASLLISFWIFACNAFMLLILPGEEHQAFLSSTLYYRTAVGILFYALIVLNYYLVSYYQEVQERKLKESETSRLLKETELSMLKSQINPHFIFNSLNSISSLTLTDPPKAHEMVVNLSSFLRYTIAPQEKSKVMLAEEIKAIEQYLAVEKVRFGKRLNVLIEMEEGTESFTVPNMILQPLVENAIKYGVYESTDKNKVEIAASINDSTLIVKVQNDVAEDAVPKKGKGIGLTNVKARMKILYGSEELIQIDKKDDHFCVTIIFPQ